MSIVPGLSLASELKHFSKDSRLPYSLEEKSLEIAVTIGFESLVNPDQEAREFTWKDTYRFLTDFVTGEVDSDTKDLFDLFLQQHGIEFNYGELDDEESGLFIRMRDTAEQIHNDASLMSVLNEAAPQDREWICLTACKEQVESFKRWSEIIGADPERRLSAPEMSKILPGLTERK